MFWKATLNDRVACTHVRFTGFFIPKKSPNSSGLPDVPAQSTPASVALGNRALFTGNDLQIGLNTDQMLRSAELWHPPPALATTDCSPVSSTVSGLRLFCCSEKGADASSLPVSCASTAATAALLCFSVVSSGAGVAGLSCAVFAIVEAEGVVVVACALPWTVVFGGSNEVGPPSILAPPEILAFLGCFDKSVRRKEKREGGRMAR